jgi:predicted PurR-regulated permease PerM
MGESNGGRKLEEFIDIGLFILLTGACFIILRPFLLLILWGVIIAIASYPSYRRLQGRLNCRSGITAAAYTGLMLTVFILPIIFVTGSLVEGVQSIAARLAEGTRIIIPPIPPRIESWPLVGSLLKHGWELASTNLETAVKAFAPQIKSIIPKLLFTSASVVLALLQWVLSILVAGVLLANAEAGARVAHSLATRLFGNRGPEFEELAAATIRSVTIGIVGVALIQTVCAGLGFILAGLPGAGVWALIFLFAAVLQVGVVVLAPAVIYMFAIASTTKAILFLLWCAIVGLMDNILKPFLLARGVAVPMAVVFLGAIGGAIAMGIIGLFAGAIILSIGYKLSLVWLGVNSRTKVELSQRSVSTRIDSKSVSAF